MSFDCNDNEMDGNCQQKPMDVTPEVITIDDDEDDDTFVDNFDGTDVIEIVEVFDPNSHSVIILGSSQMSDIKEVETELKTNETIVVEKRDSFDDCLQTSDSIKEDLNKSLSYHNSEEAVAPTDDNKNVINSPKRINPTPLATQPSTSAPVRSPDSPSDQRPTKVQRMSDLSVPLESNSPIVESLAMNPSSSDSCPKPDSETLFENYLKSLRNQLIDLKANESVVEECVQKLEIIYLKLNQTNLVFLKSKQFSKLMEVFTKEILEFKTESEVFRHHKDLALELKRLAQNMDYKEPIKTKNKAKKIMNLTATLMNLQQQIFKAENEELNYESMENKSCFTDLPKLYRKAHEVWAKREELLKRSTSTGKTMFKKYKCNSTPYPEINKCVEKLFTNYLKRFKNKSRGYVDESFTFIDVRKAILDVIKDNNLVVMNCESIIENIYKDLLNEKRYRREKDAEELFQTLEILEDLKPESFVESDPLLELELAKNKKASDQKMEALLEKFANEDRKKNSVLKDGSSEWDTDLVNNNEEFESLDVNDGELEEDNDEELEEDNDEELEEDNDEELEEDNDEELEEDNDEESDEDITAAIELIISDNETKQSSDEDIDSIDMSSDEILILSDN